MPLTPAEEQIVQAAGISAAVEGLSSIKTFGSSNQLNIQQEIVELLSNENVDKLTFLSDTVDCTSVEKDTSKISLKNARRETKLNLLKSNIEKFEESQDMLNDKLDRLLKLVERSNELKEKSIRMKEAEHVANMELKKIDLEIKTKELELLNKQF